MDKWEKGTLVLTAVSALTLFYFAAHRASTPAYQPTPEPALVSVPASDVLDSQADFLGDPKSGYTLVEFADYQCPPCIQMSVALPALLKQYPGRLRMTYRNYPLTTIHPQAMPSALAAEAAHRQGKFWAMHDGLYEAKGNLTDEKRDALVKKLHLDRRAYDSDLNTAAKTTVEHDITLAKRLKVHGTPTFFLVSPDSRVYHLGSVEQVKKLIK